MKQILFILIGIASLQVQASHSHTPVTYAQEYTTPADADMVLAVNKDGVEDEKIFKDLSVLSHGAIRIAPDELKLHEFKVIAAPATGKKKKKK